MNSIAVELISKSGESKSGLNIISIIMDSSGVVWLVLLLLIAASVFSIYIIAVKFLYLKKVKIEDREFLDVFWKTKALEDSYEKAKLYKYSPVAKVFREAFKELERIKDSRDTKDSEDNLSFLKRTIRKTIRLEAEKLESMVPYLATIGATAPFVGLFGTVWGIMSSFLNIAKEKSASLLTVAPGIAEALIATAIGLFAAIPAVIFFNIYSNDIRRHIVDMENFENDFLNVVKRYIF